MHIKQLRNIDFVFTILLILTQPQIGSVLFAQDCKANVEIRTNNNNAVIFIDSILVGKGKVNLELTRSNHSLLIRESLTTWGQSPLKDSLKIDDCNKNYIFTYELKNSGLSLNKEIPFESGYSNRGESFFSSGTFKLLLGSAVVLGGIAAYYKIQADKKYDDYLRSKNESLLNEVNRLDLYSGISFGLLQINFGYLIYKFLTE